MSVQGERSIPDLSHAPLMEQFLLALTSAERTMTVRLLAGKQLEVGVPVLVDACAEDADPMKRRTYWWGHALEALVAAVILNRRGQDSVAPLQVVRQATDWLQADKEQRGL